MKRIDNKKNNNVNLAKSIATLWRDVNKFEQPADVVLSKFFRDHRELKAFERGIAAETVYTMLRNYYKITAIIPPVNGLQMIAYTWQHFLTLAPEINKNIPLAEWEGVKKLPPPDLSTSEFPDWLQKRLALHYDETFIRDLAEAMLKPANVVLRANILKMSRDELIAKFAEQGISVSPTVYSPYGLVLKEKQGLMNNRLFLDGCIEVQDESSQLAGMLLSPNRGEMVVDFCAGSGGKTLLFGMMMRNSGRIYAFDVNDRRLNNLSPRLARSGLSNVYPQLINSENDTKVKRLAGKVDRVFVDAPCLGLGTLRRNPDLKFRQDEQALIEINRKQQAILNSAARLVKENGYLVYATCSILPEENEDIVNGFLTSHPEFEIVPVKQVIKVDELELSNDKYLQIYPQTHGCDGFFACLMQRKTEKTEL